jgi:hypothetical protein
MEIRSDWIDINEEMPANGVPVLCFSEGEVFIGMYMARFRCWYSTDWYHNEHDADFIVTCWMPLPKLPVI